MPIVKMLMPSLGEGIREATVIQWLKKEGDKVQEEEFIVEIATDKVDTEIPSRFEGKLSKILFKKDEIVLVGHPICEIEVVDDEKYQSQIGLKFPTESPVQNILTQITSKNDGEKDKIATYFTEQLPSTLTSPSSFSKNFYSPLVRNIIQQEKLTENELKTIIGTGKGHRITKKDVVNFIEKKKFENMITSPIKLPDFALTGEEEIVKMNHIRKTIAKHTLISSQLAPHVTSFIEADVTELVKWREKNKDAFFKKYEQKLTYTPLFAEMIVKVIKAYPMINISVRGDEIIKRPYINLGMAVALEDGNLIVPVIQNADQYSLVEMSTEVNRLAHLARKNKLTNKDVYGGTYTFSNIGGFGNLMGTPIIVQPQVAILALGSIEKKPGIITTSKGDQIAIRKKIFLSHSFDHRVVDGALGGLFIKKLAVEMENFDINKEI